MPRALVIQTSFLGDMVLTTPLISALARHGDVDVVATPASAPLLANHPDVRRVYRYHKRGEHSGVGGFLARRLTTIGRIVIVGGVDDTPLAAAIVEATSGRAIDTTGQLSLLASAALLGRSRILVTNDSAAQHLASAMNTPTVALFGPAIPAFGFRPLAARGVRP